MAVKCVVYQTHDVDIMEQVRHELIRLRRICHRSAREFWSLTSERILSANAVWISLHEIGFVSILCALGHHLVQLMVVATRVEKLAVRSLSPVLSLTSCRVRKKFNLTVHQTALLWKAAFLHEHVQRGHAHHHDRRKIELDEKVARILCFERRLREIEVLVVVKVVMGTAHVVTLLASFRPLTLGFCMNFTRSYRANTKFAKIINMSQIGEVEQNGVAAKARAWK